MEFYGPSATVFIFGAKTTCIINARAVKEIHVLARYRRTEMNQLAGHLNHCDYSKVNSFFLFKDF